MLRRLYASDVHVSDELRKKYPYDPKHADAYRLKLKELKK
jgi:hypothetical protein